jgi:hypothetical protein
LDGYWQGPLWPAGGWHSNPLIVTNAPGLDFFGDSKIERSISRICNLPVQDVRYQEVLVSQTPIPPQMKIRNVRSPDLYWTAGTCAVEATAVIQNCVTPFDNGVDELTDIEKVAARLTNDAVDPVYFDREELMNAWLKGFECRAIRRFEDANSTRETDGCSARRSPTFAEITRRSMSPPFQSSRSSHSHPRRLVYRGDLC